MLKKLRNAMISQNLTTDQFQSLNVAVLFVREGQRAVTNNLTGQKANKKGVVKPKKTNLYFCHIDTY